MKWLPLLLFLAGCYTVPRDNPVCAARADEYADRVTRRDMGTVQYMMTRLGNYEDEYARCTAGR